MCKVLSRIPDMVNTVEVFAIYCAGGNGDLSFFLNRSNDNARYNG